MTAFQGNSPVANNLYGVANGTSSDVGFITVFMTRNPGPNDFNYQVKTRWLNTTASIEWILTGFNSNSGVTTANWLQLGDGDAINSIAVPAGISPVVSNPAGQISFTSNNSSITITGSANSIDFATTIPEVPSSFNSIMIRSFPTPSFGPYVPTTGMQYCKVECIGAGGGGGGCDVTFAAGSGGGAGAYAVGIYTFAQANGQIITIGGGGAGGIGLNPGTAGGPSSFGALLVTSGGGGGLGGANLSSFAYSGGSGGTASGTSVSYSSPGNSGTVSFGASGSLFSGNGGNSIYGRGGNASGSTFSYGNGIAGVQGAGGSGGSTLTSSANGGTGGNGLVIITEYISS